MKKRTRIKLTAGALASCIVATIVIWTWTSSAPHRAPRTSIEKRGTAALAESLDAQAQERRRAESPAHAERPENADLLGQGHEGSSAGRNHGSARGPGDGEPGPARDGEQEDPIAAENSRGAPELGSIFGKVRLDTKAPPNGARVRIRGLGGNGKKFDFTLEVSSDGGFRRDGLPAGSYELVATHTGFAPCALPVVLKESRGAGPIDVFLHSGGELLVRVRGPQGIPLPGQRVLVEPKRSRNAGKDEILEGETDGNGEALFKPLGSGVYSVRRVEWPPNPEPDAKPPVSGFKGVPARRREEIDIGERRSVTVTPGRRVEVVFDGSSQFLGSAIDWEGTALVGAEIVLVRLPTEMERKRGGYKYTKAVAKTDGDGRFQFSEVSPGEYAIKVEWSTEQGARQSAPLGDSILLRPGATERRTLQLPAGRLSGRVAPAEGRELPRVQIQAQRVEVQDGKAQRQIGMPALAHTDDEGRYVIRGLAPGWYQVNAVPNVFGIYRIERTLVDASATGQVDDVNFQLKVVTRATLRITVHEPDGSPATGIRTFAIYRHRSGGATVTGVGAQEVSAGVYELKLEEGEYDIRVRRAGFKSSHLSVRVSGDDKIELEVTLEELQPE